MPSPGEYRLTVVAFADDSGAQGKAKTITFKVVGTPKRAPLRTSQPSSPSPIQVLESDVDLGAIPAPVGGTGVVEGDLMEWPRSTRLRTTGSMSRSPTG
jgi:hypothetical protein